jgi:hypothetical protein
MQAFMSEKCSLVSADARRRCAKQVCGLREPARAQLGRRPLSTAPAVPLSDTLAREGLEDLERLRSVVEVFRAHPEYLADPEWIEGLKQRLRTSVFGGKAH